MSAATSNPKMKRRDVVVLGEGWKGGKELADVLKGGGRIIPVKSIDEAVVELKDLKFPIGTLYFVTHSTEKGELKFGITEGYTEAADIADKLKGALSADNAPDVVDFRGCSVGTNPKAMNQIRAALGARSVIGGNCYAVIDRFTPIKIGDKEITKASDVTDADRPLFEKLKKRTLDKFGAKKKCVLNRSEKGFFAAGGRFVFLWFNPIFSGEWLPEKSVCYKDIKPLAVDPDKALSKSPDCQLIEVQEKP